MTYLLPNVLSDAFITSQCIVPPLEDVTNAEKPACVPPASFDQERRVGVFSASGARRKFLASAAAFAAGRVLPARAASDLFVIGVSTALKTSSGASMVEGVKLALRDIGENGGRRVRVSVLDDNADAARAVTNVQRLLEDERPVCLAACSSAICAQAISPLLTAARVPLVGVASGSEELRLSEYRWIYHTRAGRGVEAAAVVTQLDSLGITRIAVVHGNNTFGYEGKEGARMELSRLGIRPEGMVSIQDDGRDVETVLAFLNKSDAQAVIVVAEPAALVALVHALKYAERHFRVIAVSETGSDYCLGLLGNEARGLGFTEILPNPTRTASPLVRDYQAALKRAGSSFTPTYAGLEGYVDGRLIAWALHRWDRGASSSISSVIENSDIDIGGFRLRYSSSDRRGSSFVELAVVSNDGRLST